MSIQHAGVASEQDLKTASKTEWQHGRFTMASLPLEQGGVLPNVDLAFVTRGTLNTQKTNAVLVLHGYTSSHEFVCDNTPNASEGSWAQLVGPGKAIDTDRYFVIAPNALGSCFGSTGPGSVDPATGQPYGPTFPAITFHDIVETQYKLARHLGIRKLAAVAGVSMGGFATWQWGVQYPDFMDQLVVVLSSLKGRHVAPDNAQSALHSLQNDPHWNDGWVYEDNAIRPALQQLRKKTLLAYGMNARLSESATSAIEAEQRIDDMAASWARQFDPNSLVVLGHAMRDFDVAPQLAKLTAATFFMLASTDRLFPAAAAHETLDVLRQHSVPHQYLELETEYGHQSSGVEWHKWEQSLRDFLQSRVVS